MHINDNAYLTVRIGNCSHKGARDYQEDSFGYSNITDFSVVSEKGLAAVLADGMGGLANGRSVSDYVVSAFLEMYKGLDYTAPFGPQLKCIVGAINKEICRNFVKNGASESGSTITAAIIYKMKLYWICAGDSRLYLMRNGFIYQINEDHDYYNQLLSENLRNGLDMEAIKNDGQRECLTSYIGNEHLPYIDFNKKGFLINKGDTLILCSDGIYKCISDAELTAILKKSDAQKASERIASAVLSKNIPGQDNLTVMVIKFSEEISC